MMNAISVRVRMMARPCAYDRDNLLRRATALFWERGFAGTSVDDVVQATGVSRSSLYTVFPDKTALFLAALEHYLDTVTRAKLERLAQGGRAALAIKRFLLDVADERPSAYAPAHGCLLTNTAVEVGAGEEEIAELVRKAFARLERALTVRLEEARQQGDLSVGTEPKRFARQLVALVQGLRVMTRLGTEPGVARDAVRSALAPLRQD
ncbi:MAG: TetR/AcrR family transcriptional regulator [Hyphomonadaceae bacterium]|nr:TetR/AcrR family transcriptional regulator [Hyphomonadaceae bacterium]